MADSLDDQGFPKRQDDFGSQNPFVSPLAVEERGQGYITRPGELLNPWISMWTRPRETVRQQLEMDPAKHVLLLITLGGAAGQLGNGAIADGPELAYRVGILVGAAIGGAIWAVVCLYLGGWLVGLTGRALGGVGTALQCRTAMAWSMIPTIWTAPLQLIVGLYYVAYGADAFAVDDFEGLPDDAAGGAHFAMLLFIMAFGVIAIVIGIWQFIIYCKAIGEAHQFSAWRGFGASMLAGLAMMAVVMVIAIPIVVVIAAIAAA